MPEGVFWSVRTLSGHEKTILREDFSKIQTPPDTRKSGLAGLLGIRFWVKRHFDRRKNDWKNSIFSYLKICIFWFWPQPLLRTESPSIFKLRTSLTALRVRGDINYILYYFYNVLITKTWSENIFSKNLRFMWKILWTKIFDKLIERALILVLKCAKLSLV